MLLALAGVAFVATPGCGTGDDPRDVEVDVAREDLDQHAVSHILLRVGETQTAATARRVAYEAYAQIRAGRSFADVAESYSDHHSKRVGGFIGFVQTKANTRFAAVVEALEPGLVSRPVMTQLGFQIIKRHTYDEGKRLEAESFYAVNGFMIPVKGEKHGRLEPQEAMREAIEVVARLRAGDTTLVAERERLIPGVTPPGQSSFLFLTQDQPKYKEVVSAVKKLSPGEYSDPVLLPRGVAIVQRGKILRAIVRHILVSDDQAPNRPKKVKRQLAQSRALVAAALDELGGSSANWDAVLKKYTDDDVEERPGGMIGVVSNGDLPPELEVAVRALETGEITKAPVRSARGWHILYRER